MGVSTSTDQGSGSACQKAKGTLGFKACDPVTRILGYVSNNHIAAGVGSQYCENGPPGLVEQHRAKGDANCTITTNIGTLRKVVTINFPGPNRVDAAFVESTNAQTSDSILDIGVPNSAPGTHALGQCIKKSGRTTGLTFGKINMVNLAVSVGGLCGGTAQFTGVFGYISDSTCGTCQDPPCNVVAAPGDSGSAVLDLNNNIVGLHFGGNRIGTQALAIPIQNVLDELGLTLDLSQCATTPGPSITVTSPRGGESWLLQTTQTIIWTASNVTGNLRILLSTDGGSTYPTELFRDVPANQSSQPWTVRGVVSTTCKIKVESMSNPSVFGGSGQFTITDTAVLQAIGEPRPFPDIFGCAVRFMGTYQATLAEDGVAEIFSVDAECPEGYTGIVFEDGSFPRLPVPAADVTQMTLRVRFRVRPDGDLPEVRAIFVLIDHVNGGNDHAPPQFQIFPTNQYNVLTATIQNPAPYFDRNGQLFVFFEIVGIYGISALYDVDYFGVTVKVRP
jgi:hypothetical protein